MTEEITAAAAALANPYGVTDAYGLTREDATAALARAQEIYDARQKLVDVPADVTLENYNALQARQELNRRMTDPQSVQKLEYGSPKELGELRTLVAKTTGNNAIDLYLDGKLERPLVEGITGGDTTYSQMENGVEAMRALGINDSVISMVFRGDGVATKAERIAAERRKADLMSDPTFVAAIRANSVEANRELFLCNVILNCKVAT